MTGKQGEKVVAVRTAGNGRETETTSAAVQPGETPRQLLARVIGRDSENLLLRKEGQYLSEKQPVFEQVDEGDAVTAAANPKVGDRVDEFEVERELPREKTVFERMKEVRQTAGSEDYGDSRAFLRREGWTLADEKNGRERWEGWYQNGDVAVAGGLIRTASGRRQFFVKNPTRRFYRNAHNGRCQLEDAEVVEDAYRVHWNEKPDAFIDGIRRIESML